MVIPSADCAAHPFREVKPLADRTTEQLHAIMQNWREHFCRHVGGEAKRKVTNQELL
jgi:hypothetical protein